MAANLIEVIADDLPVAYPPELYRGVQRRASEATRSRCASLGKQRCNKTFALAASSVNSFANYRC